MKKTHKLTGIIILALIIGFTFTACPTGGGGNGGGSGGTNSGSTTPNSITSANVGKLVKINAGTFTMGSPEDEPGRFSDETQHQVTLSVFYMMEKQVTQKQYEAVMGEQPVTADTFGKGDNYPVYNVSWYDAIVFCNKLSMKEGLTPAYRISGETDPSKWGAVPTSWDASSPWNSVEIVSGSKGYRLPTEAQWEYACRAGTTTAYNTGAAISDNTGWYNANADGKTHEVGKKPSNAWGLYDMHGNVFEWCWDWYGDYGTGAQTDPTGAASGVYRVIRGGCWSGGGRILRSAYRSYEHPSYRVIDFGFRLVRS